MQKKRSILWLTLLAMLVLALAGCAPRPGAGETAAAASPDAVVVDLPALALDVAEDGSLSTGGIPLASLGAALGAPLDVALPADTVAMLSMAGVQHIQIVNSPNGLMFYLNGQAIPSLGWTASLLSNAAGLAPLPSLGKVLPIVTQLGVGVTLRLPPRQGATPIPLAVITGGDSPAARLAQAQDAFLDTVGEPPHIIIPVQYASDGTWTVAGLSGEDWQSVTGMDFWKMLNLRERDIKGAVGMGIQKFELHADPDGLHFIVNDTELPYVDWSEGKLASAIDVATDAGLLSGVGIDPETLNMLLDTFLPIVTSADVSIIASFPSQ